VVSSLSSLKPRCVKMTCAILAEGLSRRMGKDKATLDFGDGCFIEDVYRLAKTVFDNVIIVSSYYCSIKGVDVPVVGDVLSIKGSMVGIVSSLIRGETPQVFVLACDMPFVSEGSIRAVVESWEGEDIVVPKIDRGFEPLHALYRRSCTSHLLNFIQQCKLRISNLFPYVTVKMVENHPVFVTDGCSAFLKVNNELELRKAEQMRCQLEGERSIAFMPVSGSPHN
jgi:molybdopterin-guanine dinucleotide biosynthesis protein A